eukprot:SAG22_NODE_872_length_6726_cov_2.255923_3_plen_122_part_00
MALLDKYRASWVSVWVLKLTEEANATFLEAQWRHWIPAWRRFLAEPWPVERSTSLKHDDGAGVSFSAPWLVSAAHEYGSKFRQLSARGDVVVSDCVYDDLQPKPEGQPPTVLHCAPERVRK